MERDKSNTTKGTISWHWKEEVLVAKTRIVL